MNEYIAEVLGTMLLILLGNGAVANVVLPGTKGHNGGWIVITIGWGLGVFVGVTVAGFYGDPTRRSLIRRKRLSSQVSAELFL